MKIESPPLSSNLQFWMERHIGKNPVWTFPTVQESENLRFTPLTFDNYHHFLELFQNDPSPFVDERFKDAKKLYEYVAHLWIYARYSFKYGATDWLIQNKNGEWVGVFHLYELSHENFCYSHRKAFIGFAIAEKFRGNGYAVEAVQHFQNYIFTKLNKLWIVANTKKDNLRCIHFLKKLNYEEKNAFYGSEKEWYFHLFRSKKARGMIHKTYFRDEE